MPSRADLIKQKEFYDTQCNKVREESVNSTQNSLQLIAECESLGNKTANQLKIDREKLERAERNLTEMDENLTTTQKTLNRMKNVFSGLNCFSNKTKKNSIDDENEKNSLYHNKKNQKNQKSNTNDDGIGNLNQNQIQIKDNTNLTAEEQINDNIMQISSGLDILTNLSRDLGVELEDQNKLLERVNEKAEKVDIKTTNINEQMSKI